MGILNIGIEYFKNLLAKGLLTTFFSLGKFFPCTNEKLEGEMMNQNFLLCHYKVISKVTEEVKQFGKFQIPFAFQSDLKHTF